MSTENWWPVVLLGIVINTTGCVAEAWNSYATPHYGRERAEQICHPYGHCSQGTWVARSSVEPDPAESYRTCVERNMRRENGWLKNTVAFGMEVNHCMVMNGYELVLR
ncbi:MAG: hypothetical protein MRJ96_00520 [Nitrospirales bacterium]|nr:hypothetical protein [Nitrospira sp.]MDR4499923.1 hypothetical protein [Nitrospirales bacterium]